MTPEGEPGLNYLCAGYKAFFHHVDEPLRLLTQLLRRNFPAERIMPMIAARDAALAAARPNDLCPCGSGRKFKKCHGVTKVGNQPKIDRKAVPR